MPFSVQGADIDETSFPQEEPLAYVSRMAQIKARTLAKRLPHSLVLAADTSVILAGKILGKPENAAHAQQMLQQLRGRTHQVVTAWALEGHTPNGGFVQHLQISQSNVQLYPMTDAEIERYVASGDPLDKAGAYAIQNAEFRLVEAYTGCYTAIIGLPLCQVQEKLLACGFAVQSVTYLATNSPCGCLHLSV
jgi:septum formation protein